MKYTRKKTKKIFGVGSNDADCAVYSAIDGKPVTCPFYRSWKQMLRRCYSKKWCARAPSYIGCSVTKEWHSFMAFRNWMSKQNWHGKQLDKDIIEPKNKVYGPETCMFVPQHINLLLRDNKRGICPRGICPRGVNYVVNKEKYRAQLRIKNKTTHLGYYSTPEEAHEDYCLAKADYIESFFPELKGEDPRLIPALQRHADNFRKKSREQSAHSNQNQNKTKQHHHE